MGMAPPHLLVFDLHVRLLQCLSSEADVHFQGLTQAATFFKRKGMLDTHTVKRLSHIDQCYHILRHVTQPFCDSMCTSVRDQVKCNPAEHSLPRGDPVEERPAECSTSMPSDVIAAASSHTPSPRATTRSATSSDTATSSSTSPSPSPSDMNMVIEMAKTAMQDIKSYQKMNDLRLEETRAMQKDAMQAKRRYEEMIDIISEHFKTSQEVTGIIDDAPFFAIGSRVQVYANQLPRYGTILWRGCGPFSEFFRVVIDEAHRTNGIRDEWVLIADCCALAG